MPRYDVTNLTDDTAYVRVYNPAAYLIRSKKNDPYSVSFTVPAKTAIAYPDDAHDPDGAHEVIFKVKSLERPRLRSGNITFSKRNRYNDQQWQNLVIKVLIDLNPAGDTIQVDA